MSESGHKAEAGLDFQGVDAARPTSFLVQTCKSRHYKVDEHTIEGGSKYRLPSEAEWEYAARAGTTSRYFFGDDDSNLGDYAWYSENSGSKTHDVGQKKPNPWGLYDVYGNVQEWVQDTWKVGYQGAPTDGSSWEIGGRNTRVQRGCSWAIYALDCRSAFCGFWGINFPGDDGGFRLVRDL